MHRINTVIARLVIQYLAHASAACRTLPSRIDWRSERGQATTEYALVLLAAALVGVLVIGWATTGGGAAAIGRLFDRAIESVIDQL